MARELFQSLPSAIVDFPFVSVEYFRCQVDLLEATSYSRKPATAPPEIMVSYGSKCCTAHPQMKLDLYCKTCGVDVCRKCIATSHRRHAPWNKIHDETRRIGEERRRIGETTEGVVELLEEMKQAISGVKEMKQRVKKRKDNNIKMTREVFATLRKAIDEREEQTIGDIKEAAYKREKALEVSHISLSILTHNICICYDLIVIAVLQ